MSNSQAPTGLARRRRRLPDRETEQRMLDAAVHMVNRTGLAVSLDNIGLEDVIRGGGRLAKCRLPPLAVQGPVHQRSGETAGQERHPGNRRG